MNTKYKVNVSIEGRCRFGGTVEMTKEQYELWCERIDSVMPPSEREELAWELIESCGLDTRNPDIDDLEVEDFISSTLEKMKREAS